MERRPLATRIRWDNVARVAFVAALAGLVVWWPGGRGGPARLPPDVGVSPAPQRPVEQPKPQERRPVERVRGGKGRRPRPRAKPRARFASPPAPAPPPAPPTYSPPPAPGGEFGP